MGRGERRAGVGLVAACVVALVAGGCRDGSGASIEVLVDGAAVGEGYDFEQVVVGQSATAVFQIRNAGDDTLFLAEGEAVVLEGDPGAFSLTVPPEATVLEAGATVSFTVRFLPDEVGAHEVAASIHSSDPEVGAYTFTLTGTGVPGYGSLTVALSGLGLKSGTMAYAAAWSVSALWLAGSPLSDGAVELFLWDEADSPAIPLGTALRLSVFVDANGDGPTFDTGFPLPPAWPDLGDPVAWNIEVDVQGEELVTLGPDDLNPCTDPLLYVRLDNLGTEPVDMSEWEDVVACAWLWAPGAVPNDDPPVARASLLLDPAALEGEEGQTTLLFRLEDSLPYSFPEAELAEVFTFGIIVDVDHSGGIEEPELTPGDLGLNNWSLEPIGLFAGADILLPLHLYDDFEEYLGPQ